VSTGSIIPQSEGRTKKFLAKIEIQFSVRSNEYTFAIPELGLGHAETLIEDYIWNRIKDDVVRTAGGWYNWDTAARTAKVHEDVSRF
jgi:hypothetical protein